MSTYILARIQRYNVDDTVFMCKCMRLDSASLFRTNSKRMFAHNFTHMCDWHAELDAGRAAGGFQPEESCGSEFPSPHQALDTAAPLQRTSAATSSSILQRLVSPEASVKELLVVLGRHRPPKAYCCTVTDTQQLRSGPSHSQSICPRHCYASAARHPLTSYRHSFGQRGTQVLTLDVDHAETSQVLRQVNQIPRLSLWCPEEGSRQHLSPSPQPLFIGTFAYAMCCLMHYNGVCEGNLYVQEFTDN